MPCADEIEGRVGPPEPPGIEYSAKPATGDEDVPRRQIAMAHDVPRSIGKGSEARPFRAKHIGVHHRLDLGETLMHPLVVITQASAASVPLEASTARGCATQCVYEVREITGEGERRRAANQYSDLPLDPGLY